MKMLLVKKPLVTLLGCGALSLLMGNAHIGSTPVLAQAAEKPVPLTGTIHFAAGKTLAGTQWELATPLFVGAAKTPFLNFTDSRLGAGVGLNSIGGGYSISGNKISFGNLLSTRMAGLPELMRAEDRFLKALEGV
jgi:heat shock protein HslJ